MRNKFSVLAIGYLFSGCLIIGCPVLLEAMPKAPTPSTAAIIGDKDKDGSVSQAEAKSLIKDTNLKNDLFKGSLEIQTEFFNALERRIRAKLVRLSKAYNSPKWKFAIEQCKTLGITETDAVRIAKIVTKVRFAK